MSNLTVVIDDDLLRAARIKALQQGTSVNEICREAIARFAAPTQSTEEWMRELRALRAQIAADRLADGAHDQTPIWPGREALYDEIEAERMPTLIAAIEASQRRAGAKSEANEPVSKRKPGKPR